MDVLLETSIVKKLVYDLFSYNIIYVLKAMFI